ncbi:hypothetical protein [Candidatus Mycolicibacterium alkanivorans]|uniref:Uncharacterized protein n=1 Tax=Candidatus Mycolicibacterium alkanivorans TaxID=2954114 RepID=A0ABS9YSG6_9MYCO|nr:hypothetical protein [Candidatus Mycolicibacterium alkanivorans]MCI4674157.1 hypothetical protein [Candidatus Mycolicibacterium alkanivorans]
MCTPLQSGRRGQLRPRRRRIAITDTLAKSPEFPQRPERLQVQGALEPVARGVLLDRDDVSGHVTRPVKLGAATRR